jgi:hypothetical protein
VKVLRVGVDGTDKEINAAEYGIAPEGEQFLMKQALRGRRWTYLQTLFTGSPATDAQYGGNRRCNRQYTLLPYRSYRLSPK